MKKLLYLSYALVAAMVFAACGNAPTPAQEAGHSAPHEEENEVTLTAEQVKSIRISMGPVEKKQLTASVKANGYLRVPNQNKAVLTAMMGGVVRSILVETGTMVKKGQVIATIANTSFIAMQEEYLSVSSRVVMAEQELARQQELQAGNAGVLKNLQQSQADLNTLKARKTSLHKQLELVGVQPEKLTSENIRSVVNVVSPINGSISHLKVNIGSFIDQNNAVAEVIDNSQLHVDLFVYEKDLAKLKVGQHIHFTLTNNPGKEYDATIFGISNTFEPNTKAIAVHASVDGNKSGLIDGMSITALVSLEQASVSAVPTAAIVSYQGMDYIFVMKDGHDADEGHGHDHAHPEPADTVVTFERIPVRKGTTDVGYSEITPLVPLDGNAQVVTSGAFFVLAKMTNEGGHEH